MKAVAVILLFAVCYAECRKIVPPISKNANIDFINMEGGGGKVKPAVIEPAKPVAPAAPVPTTKSPVPAPAPAKPAIQPPTPAPKVQPAPPPKAQPTPPPTQFKPVPAKPAAPASPVTTPGPGSVKSLINFYDSQGKASPIRPYSYSQAVKQG